MMRMSEPNITHDEALQSCRNGITGNGQLLKRLNRAAVELGVHANNYHTLATSGVLYTIPPNLPVVGQLTKDDLIKLYEYYLVGKLPGRSLYDALLAAANEKCPFCGGIGRPRNLDHFMPKTRFPQFSILPINLIPSCRDCNMDGKGQAFARTAQEQILHPFLDAAHFFEDQWLFAEYITDDNDPNFIRYYTNPPAAWTAVDQNRVRQHFIDFDIAQRYTTQAGSHLPEIEAQLSTFLEVDTVDSFKQLILQPVIDAATFTNHWKRVMYLAISDAL
jgi:hypothetical protein